MKKKILYFLLSIIGIANIHAQAIKLSKSEFSDGLAYSTEVVKDGQKSLKVIMDPSIKIFDEPTFAKLKNINFTNGTIEVEVLSKFLSDAPDWARGFIGIAFRISDDNTRFENIYIRPDNGRSNDQIRRNHSTQYYAYPDYKFDRLRKEEPEKYESYSDMGMDEWLKMKIVVNGQNAYLYLNRNKQPSLVVTDMKHGDASSGSIGLWVGPGTEGYFRNLKITKSDLIKN